MLLVLQEETASRQARLSWAMLIRRVDDIDPLLCPFCGAEVRILAIITDFATARAIRRSLKLPNDEPLVYEPLRSSALCSSSSRPCGNRSRTVVGLDTTQPDPSWSG